MPQDRRRRPREVVPNANVAMAAAAAEAEANAAAAAAPVNLQPPPAAGGGGGTATAAAPYIQAAGGAQGASSPRTTHTLPAPAPSQGIAGGGNAFSGLTAPYPGAAARPSSGPLPFSPGNVPSFGNGFQQLHHHPGPGSPMGGGFGSPFASSGFAPSPSFNHFYCGASPAPAPAAQVAGPTLLKIVAPNGAVLLQQPHYNAPEMRRVACGAVLVAAAPHYESGGAPSNNAPSFYATVEGDWLAVGAGSGVEVLQPPPSSPTPFIHGFGSPFGAAAGPGGGFFPGSSVLHSAPPTSSPFPATPFGSPFAAAAPGPSPAPHANSGSHAPPADVAALTAELTALRAMVQSMQAKEKAAGTAPRTSTAEEGQDEGLRRRNV